MGLSLPQWLLSVIGRWCDYWTAGRGCPLVANSLLTAAELSLPLLSPFCVRLGPEWRPLPANLKPSIHLHTTWLHYHTLQLIQCCHTTSLRQQRYQRTRVLPLLLECSNLPCPPMRNTLIWYILFNILLSLTGTVNDEKGKQELQSWHNHHLIIHVHTYKNS